jgi:hypothetical protein
MSAPDAPRARGPFDWVTAPARQPLVWCLTALVVGLSLALAGLARPLNTPEAPQGIVSFELARTAEAATAIVASWSQRAREAAMLTLGLDYLYLLAYPAWLSLVCQGIARSRTGTAAGLGMALAWAIWLAAPLDALENAALVRVLMDPTPGVWPAVAWACAVPKFALVFAALGFCIVAGVPALLRRATGR